ncbi:glycosyltransferase family 2 protein [Flavobacterium aurantiibacter]|uniref:Glycosyltransferase n=1 Tax=Flavobacterium aurantiibacter TaxID=2023067 RepID=A0A255ZJE2_9FLAO|nr:glycosyltransferase family 2 protein [Flavobacterium aurantiibacter]OYQ41551.1 glycosyltransferase [Flavobacterium aurantiibacter]
MKLSVVSPVYNAERIIPTLVERIENAVSPIFNDYEIVLVEDCSSDNSWAVIEALAAKNRHVVAAKLSKNFGQHPAIMAGLSLATGDKIVVMDCDLQDQPEEIEKLFKAMQTGYDIVLAKRSNRQDGFFKKLFSRIFFKTYSYLTDSKFDNTIANFGIYDRKVIDEVLKMSDYIKSFPLFVNWVGFRTTSIEVVHAKRAEGKTSYTYRKLFKLAFDTIISFSNKPLKIFVKIGMLISLISFLVGIYTLYKYFAGEIKVLGYSSIMISIWFLSGMMITITGVVGIYIGKIFDQSKNRKPFIVEKTVNYES